MAKRIPKQLKRAILMNLAKANGETLNSAQLAERVNADPELPENYRKTSKQLAFVMKQIGKEFDDVNEVVISRNGTSHHGTARFRMGFQTNMTLAEAENAVGVVKKPQSNLKQITVNLPQDCVEYIKAWRANGVAAGRAVEALIRADIEANGLPENDQ
jgi:hypothetical protein